MSDAEAPGIAPDMTHATGEHAPASPSAVVSLGSAVVAAPTGPTDELIEGETGGIKGDLDAAASLLDGGVQGDEVRGTSKSKGKGGGAPAGRRNGRFTHGFFSRITEAYRSRTKLNAECEREALAIVTEAGIADLAIGRRLGRSLAKTDYHALRLHLHHERRGYLDQKGNPKASFTLELQLMREDRADIRDLIGRFAEVLAANPIPPPPMTINFTTVEGVPIPVVKATDREARQAALDANAIVQSERAEAPNEARQTAPGVDDPTPEPMAAPSPFPVLAEQPRPRTPFQGFGRRGGVESDDDSVSTIGS